MNTLRIHQAAMVLLVTMIAGCAYMVPYPDYRLTYSDSAWGSVRRGEPYVLLKDYRTHVDWNGLSQTTFPRMEDLGVLPKGTIIQFTALNVSRNHFGAQPFVYGEVLSGNHKGKTFSAIGLVRTAKTNIERQAWIVEIEKDAVKPLL